MIKHALLMLWLMSVTVAWGQDRYQSGELKGFTISREEHIITHLDDPLTVREVKGTAFIANDEKAPLEGVLFELRGPGDSDTIRSTKTGRDGNFALRHIRPGKYLFKATSLGFQSLVGVVIVSPKAGRDQAILLRLKPGV